MNWRYLIIFNGSFTHRRRKWHSSIIAWKISWAEEPGGLQSMGSQRVGHDWLTNTFFRNNFYFMKRSKYFHICVWVSAQLLQSCPTLCDPVEYKTPGSSVHGVSPGRVLSGLPCPPPWDLPDPGIELVSLKSPALAGWFFTTSTTGEAHVYI